MHLTGEDINELGETYKARLKNAVNQLPDKSMTLSEIQDWMMKNHLESPEILEQLINKLGAGVKGGEKKTVRNAGVY